VFAVMVGDRRQLSESSEAEKRRPGSTASYMRISALVMSHLPLALGCIFFAPRRLPGATLLSAEREDIWGIATNEMRSDRPGRPKQTDERSDGGS
jgi:hypothetical protein